MFTKKLGLILLSSSLLIACGGSDSEVPEPPVEPQPGVTPPVTGNPDPTEYDHQVQGVLAFEGAIGGADICIDLDMNSVCDTNEPSSTTDNDGQYQIDWKSEVEVPSYYLVANWVDSTRSNVSQPQILSRSFKANKRTSVEVSKKYSNRTEVFNDGNGQLIALSDHQGAINALTHIEFKRYEQMLAQGLDENEIADLRLQLGWLVDGLYAADTGNAYQVTANISNSEAFKATYQTHMHVAALIGDQLNATLAIEKVLALSGAAITALAEENQLSLTEFLATDPIEVRYIVSDSLIAQGYIETPFDEKIINDNDWQVLRENLFNDGVNHDFTLHPPSSLSTFTLEYGEATKFILGFVSEDGLTGREYERTPDLTEELCWDNQSNAWKDSDTSYPNEGQISNNTISFSSFGTTVQTKLKFEKYNTSSDTWNSIINAQPPAFNFEQVQWPEYVYRYYVEQNDDVMCKAADPATFVMPAASVAALTSDDIARTVWSVFYPDNVIIDEDKREIKVSYTAGEYSTFIWEHDTSPNGSPLIRIISFHEPINGQTQSTFQEYLVQDGLLIEVEINQSSNFDDFSDHLLLSYDGETNGFSQHFLAHIKALLPSTQP